MPGGDRTGPRGMGPMTGWGRGPCGGPGGSRWGSGGYGRGGGRGWRDQFGAFGRGGWSRGAWMAGPIDPEPPAESERRWLELRSAALEAENRDIKARLEALAQEPED